MRTSTFGTRLMIEDVNSLVTPLPGRTFIDKLIPCVSEAKFSIDIIQYEWNFYPGRPETDMQRLNRTVIAKSQSGTKIRVLLNKEGQSGHLTAINMLCHRFLSEAGALVKFTRSFPTTHAKMWLFDDDSVIFGSHNLSNRSVTVNNEVSCLIKSKAVCLELRRYFDTIWVLS